MKTHFAPFTDLEDLEQAPCGTWLGEASELSGDWAEVDCRLCQKRKKKLTRSSAAEERAIIEQMGDMAAFMRAEDSASQENICTPNHCNPSPLYSLPRYGGKGAPVLVKQYPLEVQSVGSDTYIAMSKGHHDFEAFMAEAVKECPGWFLGGPQHKWCKTVPDRSGEFSHRYVFVEEGTPGAWPATYCWEFGEDYKRYNAEVSI